MLVYWYWAHRHLGVSSEVLALQQLGDTVVVQALSAYNGVSTERLIPEYEVIRDLPDPLAPPPRWARRIGPLRNAVRRQVARHRLVADRRPDVCYIETLEAELDIFTLPFLRWRTGTSTVGVVHDVRPHESRWPRAIEDALLRRLYRPNRLDHIVVLHDRLAGELRHEFGVSPDRMHVKPMGLEARPRTEDRPHMPFVVMFFGTFRSNKGLPILVEAIRSIPADEEVRYVFAGAGDADLENLVGELVATRPDVHAEIGRVPDDRREELLAMSDLLVLPYTSFHSQSGVLEDAYERGIPLVVADVGGLGPAVRKDESGWVLESVDAGKLRAAILHALTDRDDYARRVAAVRAAAEAHGPAQSARVLHEAYRAAVDHRRS